MMHWYHWFLLGVFSELLAVFLVAVYKRPYRWQCKICQFKVSTNNRETLATVLNSHTHDYVEED